MLTQEKGQITRIELFRTQFDPIFIEKTFLLSLEIYTESHCKIFSSFVTVETTTYQKNLMNRIGTKQSSIHAHEWGPEDVQYQLRSIVISVAHVS